MQHTHLWALTTLSTTIFTGCQETAPTPPTEEKITPRLNADGNYNIIFITADQEHFMENYPIGSNYKGRTRLRQLGTTFQKHYSCSNVSTPSRSAIYTGMHITQTRMLDNTNYDFQLDMNPALTTIGHRMRNLGYYTAYKGKWHLSKPGPQGSDHTHFLEQYGFSDWEAAGDPQGGQQEGFLEDGNIAQHSNDWIKGKGDSLNNAGKSFFLCVNFVNPHDIMYFDSSKNPSQTPQTSILKTEGAPPSSVYTTTYPTMPIPQSWNQPIDSNGRVQAHKEYFENWNKMVGIVPPIAESWERFRDYYYNCIQDSDNQLELLLALLQEKKMLNNTIIIMTADHGEMLGAHGLRGKGGFMYDDNIHVPLIIYHPEQPGGRRCNNITSHLDLAPTILDLTHSPGKTNEIATLKGHSLSPLMNDPNRSIRNDQGALFVYDMISMIDGNFIISPTDNLYKIDPNRGFLRGIITAQYKFARYFSPIDFNTPNNIDDLYRNNDVEMFAMSLYGKPSEMENLAADKNRNTALIIEYNNKLNSLINKEIGIDNGQETEAYHPGGIRNFIKQK